MKRKRTISEMSLGMGSMASGAGEFAEADDDMGPPSMDDGLGDMDDMGGDMGDDMGMDDEMGEEDDMVTCSKDKLREALERLESGECSVDECLDEICAGDDMGDDMDMDMDDEMGGDLDDEIGGVDEESDPFSECGGGMMESISKIANMITEDPDIMRG